MNNQMKPLTIKCSLLLSLLFFIEWWLVDVYGPLTPGYIPNTNINIEGSLILLIWIVVLTFYLRQLTRFDNSISIWKLTWLGTTVVSAAELLFQFSRTFLDSGTLINGTVGNFLRRMIILILLGATLSFFIAFQLKTRRTFILLIMIFTFMAIVYFIRTKWTT